MKFNNTISVTPIVRFITHKEKESMSSCQDYYNYNLDNNCFAIADGATQSFYPSIWAQLLVDSFCSNPEVDQDNWQEWLKPIQDKWLETVKGKVKEAEINKSPVSVTNRNRLNQYVSATSTFIGIQFIENQAKISLVGDSCLFIFQDHKLLKTYLLEKSEEFGYRPEYFASYRKNNDFAPKFLDIDLKYDKFSTKLYFVIATDALAEYIFKHIESEQQDILNTLLALSSQEEFDDFVASARNNDPIKMKNDDVTLVILEVNHRKISSFPTEIKEGKLEKSGFVRTPSPEGESDSVQKMRDEPEHSDISSDINDETSEKNPNSRELQNPINSSSSSNSSTTMGRKNSRGVSSSSHQLKKEKPPVIKGIDGIRNLLLILGVLNLATLYFAFRSFNKISGEQLNQPITQNPPEQTVQKTAFEPKYVKLDKGEYIYQDQNFQQITIPNLSNSSQGLILEEGENWIKFEVDIYAYESIVNNSCDNCEKNEIEIQPDRNLRTFPSQSEEDIFGKLSESSKFKKLDFNSLPQWYKLKFVGYVKK